MWQFELQKLSSGGFSPALVLLCIGILPWQDALKGGCVAGTKHEWRDLFLCDLKMFSFTSVRSINFQLYSSPPPNCAEPLKLS